MKTTILLLFLSCLIPVLTQVPPLTEDIVKEKNGTILRYEVDYETQKITLVDSFSVPREAVNGITLHKIKRRKNIEKNWSETAFHYLKNQIPKRLKVKNKLWPKGELLSSTYLFNYNRVTNKYIYDVKHSKKTIKFTLFKMGSIVGLILIVFIVLYSIALIRDGDFWKGYWKLSWIFVIISVCTVLFFCPILKDASFFSVFSIVILAGRPLLLGLMSMIIIALLIWTYRGILFFFRRQKLKKLSNLEKIKYLLNKNIGKNPRGVILPLITECEDMNTLKQYKKIIQESGSRYSSYLLIKIDRRKLN
jgi:hypothetical protein